MASNMGGMASKMMDARMANAQNTGSFGNQGGFQKFMGMSGSQAPQQPQGMMQNGPGMDQQFGSLIQMMMGGAQPRGRR